MQTSKRTDHRTISARRALLLAALLLIPSLSAFPSARAWQFPVQAEQVVRGSSTGLAAAQADDGSVESLTEADIASDQNTTPYADVRVQNGSVALGAAVTFVEVAIAPVAPAQSLLTFSASFDDANPGASQVSGTLLNATTIRFERTATGPALSLKWYVAEFRAGVTVQRGTATMAGALLDIPIAAVNLARSFPVVSYRIAGTGYGDNDFLRAKLTSATNLQVKVSGGTGGTVEWQVVDHSGAAVQTGDVSFATTDARLTAAVAAVNVSKAWLLYTYVSPSGSGANIGQKMVRGLVTDGTTLTFDRDSTGQTIDLTWYLVAFTDATTVAAGSTTFTAAETAKDVAIPCVDSATTIATAGGMFYRGGKTPYTGDDNPGVASVTLDMTSATNLRLTRGTAAGSTATVGWFVVRFAAYLGCRLTGTYPSDVAAEDGVFVRYREGLLASTSHAPGTQTITFGSNCGGTFPADLASSGNDYLCLREASAGSIGFDASSSTSGSAASLTFAHTVSGANRLLLVGVSIRYDATQTVSSITYNGAALTFIRSDTLGTSTRTELWYRIAPSTGTNNVVVTLSGTAKFSAGAASFTGVHQTTPVDAQSGATGTSSAPSVTVTSVTDGAWVLDTLAFRSTGAGIPTGTPGSGQTERWSQYTEGGGAGVNIRGKGSTEGPKAPAGPVVMDWALSASVDWSISGVAIRPATANSVVSVQHDFAAVPMGDAYDLCVEAYVVNAAGESMLLQVLTPPATWNTRITVSKTADDNADQCYTLTAAEYNGGAISVRWIGGTETGDTTASDLRIDGERVVRRYTSYRLDPVYQWTGVPAGDAYSLVVKGYRGDENVNVQVLTPPATWNTRIVLNSVSNTVFSYTLAAAEYNGGSPSVRFADAVPSADGTSSDVYLDGVRIATLQLQYVLDVDQTVTGVMNGRNPFVVLKGSVSAAGENFDVQAWNFTTGAWDLLLAASFTATNAYHNVSLPADYLSGGVVRIRYVDAGAADTAQGTLRLDYVAVDVTNGPGAPSNGGVSPTSGDISTSFTFFVRYTDLENEPPAFVNLTLGGVPYAMSENATGDMNYADGKDYFLVVAIGVRGTYPFYFTTAAAGGDLSPTSTPTQTVSVLNRVPTITNPIALDGVHTGAAYARDFDATDLDADTLTWSVATNASWLSIGPANGTVWGAAPGSQGVFSVNVTADDGFGGSAWDAYNLSVGNLAPSVTNPIASDAVHAGRGYARDFDALDPDGDTVAWSLTTNAPWLAIGPSNGTVWGTAPSSPGFFAVNVTADDGFGGSAWDAYNLSVGNVAPAVTNPIASDAVHAGRGYVRDFNALDPDGDPVTWSLATNAPWLTLGPANGTVWGIAPASLGSFFANASAADGYGGRAWVNYTLTVGNVAPSITNPIATASAARRAAYARDFDATDLDGDLLSWSLRTNAAFLAVGPANGTVYGVTANVPASYWVEVRASDPFGGSSLVNFTLTVVNAPPQVSVSAPPTAVANATYAGSFSGSDPDGDALTWSLATNASWLSIDPVAGTLGGSAVAGTYYANVTARDPYGGVASRNVTIVVSAALPPSGGAAPWTSLSVLILGATAFAVAVLVAAKRRPRSVLEQAFLVDDEGDVRFAYTAREGLFDEPALRGLLRETEWHLGVRLVSGAHTLHLVHRPEGHWVLVSRSTDAARVRAEAESVFALAKADVPGLESPPPPPPPAEAVPADGGSDPKTRGDET